MRTIVKAILALAFIGAMGVGATTPVKAQYPFPPPPPPPPPYYGYPPPSPYGYYPPPRWRNNYGCPPHYTVQDGVCKPYRGY